MTKQHRQRNLVSEWHRKKALIVLGVACWPGPPLVGMLTYSAIVTLYLASVGFSGGLTGILLWPAVGLHVILTILLAWTWFREGKKLE